MIRGLIAALLMIAGIAAVGAAGLPVANGGLTGQWFNLERSGEGFFVEVVSVDGVPHFAVSWFTYDAAGNQMWLVGSAEIPDGAMTITLPVFVTDGARFGAAFDPDEVNLTPWGTLSFSFPDCDSGLVSYSSELGFGAGEIELVRLTSIMDFACRPPPQPGSVRPGLWTVAGTPEICFWISKDGSEVSDLGSGCGAPPPIGHALQLRDSFVSNGISCEVNFRRDISAPILDDRFEFRVDDGPIPLISGKFTGDSFAVLTYNDGKGCFNEYVLQPGN